MKNRKKLPVILIIFSTLSFIPAIGVIFGLISIIIGLTNFRRFKLLVILGASGIGLTIVLYGCFYLLQQQLKNNKPFEEVRIKATEMFLNDLSDEILNFKCKNGSYPDSLEQVANSNRMIVITDMFNPKKYNKDTDKRKKNNNYYYKVEKDTFILFSVGTDGLPFTKDDILPHDKNIKPFGK